MMLTTTQERPLHASGTYYAVVLGNGEYLGWRCTFAGDGGMRFRHADGREKKFEGGPDHGWMRKCWDAFTEFAATQSEEQRG